MLRNTDRHDILKRLEALLHDDLQHGITNADNYANWNGNYNYWNSSSMYTNNASMMLPQSAIGWPPGLAEHINRVAIATASHILDEVLTKREYQEAVKMSYLDVLSKMIK